MAFSNARQTVLLGLTTVTTSGNSGVLINVPQGYSGVIFHADALTVSGTTPTLVVYAQNAVNTAGATDVPPAIPTGAALFQDLISLATLTTSNTNAFGLFMQTSSTVVAGGQQNATLTAGTANNGPLGAQWRIAWVVSGTTPSFAFSVSAMFVPEG
jgi:hypothetical protein